MNLQIEQALKKGGGIITVPLAAELGVSRMVLSKCARNGELERVGPGIYIPAGEFSDEMYVLQLRSPRVIFSHESALWLNGLSDREPFEMSVTYVTGAPPAKGLRSGCRCHYVRRELLEVGLGEATTAHGHAVRCYNAERTICDVVRSSRRLGIEEKTEGLKRYVASSRRDFGALLSMAELFGVADEVSGYMEVLS